MELHNGESHAFDGTLLRENDLRGIFGVTLRPADTFALGLASGLAACWTGAAANSRSAAWPSATCAWKCSSKAWNVT